MLFEIASRRRSQHTGSQRCTMGPMDSVRCYLSPSGLSPTTRRSLSRSARRTPSLCRRCRTPGNLGASPSNSKYLRRRSLMTLFFGEQTDDSRFASMVAPGQATGLRTSSPV
ncbi:uncharacterized protein LOC111246917 isoform X2 [Varroa destructor]|uniref:Uncharacterized protein n=1 Tax=Varroa destructor TaxID=109461 RepID=A0A7M7JJB1_VARDE|nr:uncharacterized protein LOC111246917 isoform X2 [Varroa destructor]